MNHRMPIALLVVGMLLASSVIAAPPPPKPDVAAGQDGKLAYVSDANGNRIPDFSSAGYRGGGVAIPDVPVKVVVSPVGGDNTQRIQSAIDYVASLPPDEHGIRGAVLLQKGRFKIDGGLVIKSGGGVLRGSGMSEDGTILLASGTDRRTLIRIIGKDDRKIDSHALEVEGYTPVGAARLRFRGEKSNLKPGDTIVIRRPSTAEWIKAIGMDYMGGDRHSFTWKPGTRDITWDRTITAIEANQITFDAPITTALDPAFGGGTVATYAWPGRITQVGVENLRCESAFDSEKPKDEEHAWFGITMENTADAWVRQVTFTHFAGSAVAMWDTCKRITVEDCKSLAPISEIAGWRRHTFFTSGSQCLFQRCYAEQGRHDFAVGFCAAGPNAFVQCTADNALDDSGPIDSWASGVLFDNVRIDGNALTLDDRAYRSQGAGWAAANCVLWGCQAALIDCDSPPTAVNWSFGSWGSFSGDGRYVSSRESVRPISLYYGQLADRLGDKAEMNPQIMITPSDPSSNPSPDVAMQLSAAATQPMPRMNDWIDASAKRHPISIDAAGAKAVDDLPQAAPTSQPAVHRIALKNGWIVSDNGVVLGGRQGITWWSGGVRPDDLPRADVSPTRYVPGRIGRGLTDDLNVLTDGMREQKRAAIDYHYGLWYDTRDADHERIRRMDGDVWPPFYELPFARSGKDLAWDGLSKYDLTKYNTWYWNRLAQLADLCDQKELVLLHHDYFQHNILEAGAHWASNPWRSANNINDTGFPEPPPYVGDKRIFMAEQFYDINQPTRRKLHEMFIRKSLDNFVGKSNVIQCTSYEFTGPLHFMQFWLDTIAAWEKETGKTAIVALSCTKDVQDAILADPTRAAVVNVIDIRYWWYQADGTPYTPEGGKNLAPRQHERVIKHRGSSAEQVARAVREYRTKYPDKAVIYSADNDAGTGWAQLLSGGSLAQMGQNLDVELRQAIAEMKPAEPMTLEDSKGNRLVYSESPVDAKAFSSVRWINPKTGRMSEEKPASGPYVAWLKK